MFQTTRCVIYVTEKTTKLYAYLASLEFSIAFSMERMFMRGRKMHRMEYDCWQLRELERHSERYETIELLQIANSRIDRYGRRSNEKKKKIKTHCINIPLVLLVYSFHFFVVIVYVVEYMHLRYILDRLHCNHVRVVLYVPCSFIHCLINWNLFLFFPSSSSCSIKTHSKKKNVNGFCCCCCCWFGIGNIRDNAPIMFMV